MNFASRKVSKRPLAQCRLYGFVDMGYLKARDPLQAAQQMIAGSVDILQLRDKRGDTRQTLELARRLKKITDTAGVIFIVNDSPHIARLSGADGVHLGQEDLQTSSVTAARHIFGKRAIVGVSTHSLTQALDAARCGADYIGVGPVFPTATKPGVKPVGLKFVSEATAHVRIPFFAIGGIHRRNIGKVQAAGAQRVAVVSDILCADEVTQSTRELKNLLNSVSA